MVKKTRKRRVKKKWVRNKNSIGSKASAETLKRYCKEIWSEYVKERDNHQCVMCSNKTYLNSHHIITSKCLSTKYTLECGITLCSKCHSMGKISAHSTPWIFYEWLEKHRPAQYKWFIDNRHKIHLDDKVPKNNVDFYKTILKKLLETFETDYPLVIQRSKYYKFNLDEENKIVNDYIQDVNTSVGKIAYKYKITNEVLKGILRRHNVKLHKNPKKFYKDGNMVIKKVLQLDLNNNRSKISAGFIWKYG